MRMPSLNSDRHCRLHRGRLLVFPIQCLWRADHGAKTLRVFATIATIQPDQTSSDPTWLRELLTARRRFSALFGAVVACATGPKGHGSPLQKQRRITGLSGCHAMHKNTNGHFSFFACLDSIYHLFYSALMPRRHLLCLAAKEAKWHQRKRKAFSPGGAFASFWRRGQKDVAACFSNNC